MIESAGKAVVIGEGLNFTGIEIAPGNSSLVA